MEPVGCLLQKSADVRKIEKGPYFKRKSRVILAVRIKPQYTEVTLPSNLPDLKKKSLLLALPSQSNMLLDTLEWLGLAS